MKPLEWPFGKLCEKANGSWFPSNETKLFAALKVSFTLLLKLCRVSQTLPWTVQVGLVPFQTTWPGTEEALAQLACL